jgi:rod shape-determining protein MreD
MSIYLRNFLRFLLLVGIQVLLLNKLPLRWWANPEGFPSFVPFVYPLFLLLLPISTPIWFVLISGFVLGTTVDMFMNTPGVHAAACVFMAFCRIVVLKVILPRKLYEYRNLSPTVKTMGWAPFLTYAAVLLALHHTYYLLLQIWNLSAPLNFVLKLFASLVTSMLFVLLYALLFSKSIDTQYRGE